MMDNFYFGHMGGWGLGGYIGSFALWIVGILFVVWLIRELFMSKYKESASETFREEKTALEIIKERYAKGEITKKEYEEKKKEFLS